MPTHLYMYMHTCIYRHTYIITCAHIQIYACMYITHTHTHIHVPIYTYSLIECSDFVALLWFGYELSLTGSILY